MVYIVEGDLATARFPYESLLGAVVNANIRKNSFVFRTLDLDETARLIRQLVDKLSRWTGTLSLLQPPLVSKRQRGAEVETVWTRQLMCIPSISERIARLLLEHFGNLRALQEALEDLKSFPKIRLDDRTCIGKTRLKMLARYLT